MNTLYMEKQYITVAYLNQKMWDFKNLLKVNLKMITSKLFTKVTKVGILYSLSNDTQIR